MENLVFRQAGRGVGCRFLQGSGRRHIKKRNELLQNRRIFPLLAASVSAPAALIRTNDPAFFCKTAGGIVLAQKIPMYTLAF